jgi:hypothetical protein
MGDETKETIIMTDGPHMKQILSACSLYNWIRVSSVIIVTRLGAGRARYHGSTPERGKNFVLSVFSRSSIWVSIVGDLPGKKNNWMCS